MPPGKAPFSRPLADMTNDEILNELKKIYPNYQIFGETFGWYKIIICDNNSHCLAIICNSNYEWKFRIGAYKPQEITNLKHVDTFEEIIYLINNI